jgi:glycosyltransferase involved in cell wall biosynthesis
MSKLRLSIIIPMYNVAPYVDRCLSSLANQDIPYDHFEIICVNDGSPDNCSEIVKRLQNEIPNIILIDQENQGVSMARNNAMAIAKGNYILPIDPDDYVVPNCLKKALEKAENEQLDVLYCAFEIFDENSKPIWRTNYSHLEQKIDSGYEGYFAVRGITVKDPDRSVAILYKRATLNEFEIRYPKDIPYLEDGLFLGKVFSVAKKVGYSNNDFYQRTTRIGSATHSNLYNTDNARRGFAMTLSILNEFIHRYKITGLSLAILNQVKCQFALKYVISCRNSKLYKEAIPFIKTNKEIFANEDVLRGEGFLEKMYFRFIIFSPSLFFLLQPILVRFVFHVRNIWPNK